MILAGALFAWGCSSGSSDQGNGGSGGTSTPGTGGIAGSSGPAGSGPAGAPGNGGSGPAGAPGNGGSGPAGAPGKGGSTGVAGGAAGSAGSGTGAGGSAGGGTTSGITVKLDATHQTIQGFGINTALMPSKTLPIDKLFGTSGTDAIGLTILRVGMNPDGTLTGQNVSDVKNKGGKVIGSCWSPPKECKTNMNTQQGGSLVDSTSCYDMWATKIVNFAKAQGLYAMSVGNESDFASCKSAGPPCTDDYDTTTYTAKQMVKWVKYVGPKLQAAGIKVIAPEASEWIHAWSNISATGSTVSSHPNSSDPLKCGCYGNTIGSEASCTQTCKDGNGYDYGHWMAKDADAWKAFDIFGVHEYDSQIAFAWPADVTGGKRDKEIWQTEMSGVKYWPEEGPSTDIKNGVAVAGWIHSALTVGEASAWLWWWYESYYQNDNEGLAIIQGSSTIAKRYYTLGQYSKFVRPDYIAVEVAGNTNKDLLISGYKGPDGTVVVVAINKGSAAANVPIAISGGAAPAMMTPTVTSSSDSLKTATAGIAVTGGSFMASLPSMTVTTFVGK